MTAGSARTAVRGTGSTAGRRATPTPAEGPHPGPGSNWEATAAGLVETRQRGDARAVSVPHRSAAVSAARRVVLKDVVTKLDAATVHEAAVVVSELLGNAVRHADPLEDGRLLLRWQVRSGVLDLEVTDGGSGGQVRPLRPTTLSVHGRGLRIVRSMAHEWGVVEDVGRRTVWASLGGPSRRRRRAV